MDEVILRRTWAEIDLDALAFNMHALKAHIGENTKILGVVKANGYGHGAVEISRRLEQEGADYLAVACSDEALELRRAGIRIPVLVMGYTPPELIETLIGNQVEQAVPPLEWAQAYSREAVRCGRTLTVHLKLDTGMGRFGFQCDQANYDHSVRDILEALKLPGLFWKGVFTHFSVADDIRTPENAAFTQRQYERFTQMYAEVEHCGGYTFPLHHCCNSDGSIYWPQFRCDMCRPGLAMYGLGLSARTLGLKPVMTLKSAVGTIKEYASGSSINYGRTYITDRPRRLGVLPIGYGDGFSRGFSNRGKVLTQYGPAPIVGRVCMDVCTIDLTDLPEVRTGDVAEVWGPNLSIDDQAADIGIICQELLTVLGKRVPRIYMENGREVRRDLALEK